VQPVANITAFMLTQPMTPEEKEIAARILPTKNPVNPEKAGEDWIRGMKIVLLLVLAGSVLLGVQATELKLGLLGILGIGCLIIYRRRFVGVRDGTKDK